MIAVHSGYDDPVMLEVNDSIHIGSFMGHALLSLGDQPARIISIVASYDRRFRDAFQACQLAAAHHLTVAVFQRGHRSRPPLHEVQVA